jgi:hypothetical protein
MKPVKVVIFVALVVAVGCIVAGVAVARRDAAQKAARERARADQNASEQARNQALELALPKPSAPEPLAAPPKSASPVPPARTDARGQARTPPPASAAQVPQPPRPPPPPLQDPVARVALSWVGFDPTAEQYWAWAINDPRLPGHERQDLIEDLNEEGFADPRNVTADDLPLIVSRLRLIERLAPDAMDKVNADAFQEAYKDLVNMVIRLTQQ